MGSRTLSFHIKMLVPVILISAIAFCNCIFKSITSTGLAPGSNPSQLNYGVAITDVDGQKGYEVVVAGYNGPNLVLKWNQRTKQLENIATDDPSSPYYALRDVNGQAIGVTACDVDGDGREEIYFLNTNSAYSGKATYPDKLFKWRDGKYVDIFSDRINLAVSSFSAGRSVGCIDRFGNGKYGIYLANYASGQIGAHDILEMDEASSNIESGIIAMRSVGQEAGIRKFTGGRGVTVGPIVSNRSDIFCDNERGSNFLFQNQGDGTFTDIAQSANIEDTFENGRGVALSDFDDDGKIDIVYGNWNGPHRLYLQRGNPSSPYFKNIASGSEFSYPTPIRTVIAADFDNDANQEIFMNNIAYRGSAPNSVHTVRKTAGVDPIIQQINIGDALEENGKGTGGAVLDLDNDGRLELVLSHGESGEQPLTLYEVEKTTGLENNWLRVEVLTPSGAPARGAKVSVTSGNGRKQSRVIDSGSGYLCQMEPVAHFGLNKEQPTKVEVLFTDGSRSVKDLAGEVNMKITIKQQRQRSGRVIALRRNSIVKIPEATPVPCSFSNQFNTESCDRWNQFGYCSNFSIYYDWMMSNCQKSCLC